MMESEIRAVFEDALRVAGIAADVRTSSHNNLLRVRIMKDGDVLGKLDFTDREMVSLKKDGVLSIAAHTVVGIKQKEREYIEWGEKAVVFDSNDACVATCLRCGATAQFDALDHSSMVDAEMCVPRPTSSNLEKMDGMKKKFVLLALLRDECKIGCPNSPKDL